MTDDPHPAAEPRHPYTALRAWEPARDPHARARARALLELHIEDAAVRRRPRRSRRRPRPPRRWLVPVVTLIAVAGGGGAVAAVLLRTEHTAQLAVFTAQGRLAPRFHVGARARGYCWESSLAADTPNAYRCFRGNLILDPCFAPSAHARTVACFLDPWHPVTLLRLTRRLPRPGPPIQGTPLPWAIVTTDGRRCTFMTGATAPIAGERINYACSDHTYLIGSPHTRAPLWTIRSARRFTLSEMHAPIRRFPLVGIRQTIG